MSDQADFTKNVLPYLAQLEEDEAGPDPAEISQRYGISENSIVMLSRNENPYGPSPLSACGSNGCAAAQVSELPTIFKGPLWVHRLS